jgi:hypothetical protein
MSTSPASTTGRSSFAPNRRGTNVTAKLPLPGGGMTATLTFFEVFATGVTTLDALNGAPPLPAGYLLAGGRYYDISTTADYGEPATLCIPFDPLSFSGSAVRLLHFDGSVWIDVTTMSDRPGWCAVNPRASRPSRSPPAQASRRWRRSSPGRPIPATAARPPLPSGLMCPTR